MIMSLVLLGITLLFGGYMFWNHHRRRRGHGIDLLVPFRSDNGRRLKTWEWLKEYWRHELPGAKIIIGTDDGTPFSKATAVNDAAGRGKGDVLVILDADCYISGYRIMECARRIRKARKHGKHIWFMPFRHFFRLSDEASRRVLDSDPEEPYRFPSPPDPRDVQSTAGSERGHWYGALIQIMPREAFELVGGMDPRFRGWGSEDAAFMYAVDTLYGKHKTTNNDVLHLWHPSFGNSVYTRTWAGQKKPGTNHKLGSRYHGARGDLERMRALTLEWQ